MENFTLFNFTMSIILAPFIIIVLILAGVVGLGLVWLTLHGKL